MKNLLYLSLMFFASSCAPSKKIVKRTYPSPFEFSLTDTVPGDKSELYVRAFEWISRSFGSAKAVVDMHDKEEGKIIGKSTMEFTEYPYGNVDYVISIDVRNGRYRFILSNFTHEGKETTTRYGVTSGYGYGDLNKDKVIRRMPDTGTKREDKHYYNLKNFVSDQAQSILESIRMEMKKTDTF